MKKLTFVSLALIAVLAVFLSLGARSSKRKEMNVRISLCGSYFQIYDDLPTDSPVELHEGLGDLHYAITTNVPDAQKYFDQGLRLIYGFNHVEALRSFQKAASLDPSSPMIYWGQALALGPNINDWNPKDREQMAFNAIKKARATLSNGSQREVDFIMAMAARYDGKAYEVRDSLNNAYTKAMGVLVKKYPDDPEALTLFADAVMTASPWDYWNKDGSPKPFTTTARNALEAAIKKFPKHPGAHHFYVHLIEASNQPGDALKSAGFLEDAMPSAGHLVHMPSHIYVRVGSYDKSNASNVKAIIADEEFLTRTDDQGLYRLGYYPHNIDFLFYGQMMTGQRAGSVQNSTKLVYQMQPMASMMPVMHDFFLSMPQVAMTRFGRWNEVLALPQPPANYFHASTTFHFTRGLALLRKGKLPAAKKELAVLDSINRLDTLQRIVSFYNKASGLSNVATLLLKGEVLLAEKNMDAAFESLRAAAEAEDALRYNEPPDWRLPARHFLGAALLDAGKYDKAETVFTEDLKRNPENGWSLKGLQQAQLRLGKTKEAAQTTSRFQKVWKDADVEIMSSRF